MIPGLDGLSDSLRDECRPHRQSTAKRLCQRHDVWFYAIVLVGPQLTGSAQPALNLIEDQQRTKLIAELAQRCNESQCRDVHTAFALNWLNEDCAGIRPDQLGCRINIVE